MNDRPEVAIVGLGYVGLTLAVSMAQAGIRVWGYERERSVVDKLRQGKSHIFEPGLEDALREQINRNLSVGDRLPETSPDAVIVCVSTPVGDDNLPDLRNLDSAARYVAESIDPGTLVVVRSTVPVGTTRSIVLPTLQSRHESPMLAFCPERTIQGKALQELRSLPQVVGAIDDVSQKAAVELWERVTDRVIPVESPEAAELVKLVNNCHTDLLYAFGNEVALMASQFGIDPMDVIRAANIEYPRPNVARPGFVAGPCLTKDPYLLINSFGDVSYSPSLVADARHINESLPVGVADHFMQSLGFLNGDMNGAKVLVCGFAYKGWPMTDDVRGSSTKAIMERLSQSPLKVYGHDFLVPHQTIKSMGATPVDNLSLGLDDARAVLFVNEHPDYRDIDIASMTERMRKPALVYDSWRMFDAEAVRSIPGLRYAGIGYG